MSKNRNHKTAKTLRASAIFAGLMNSYVEFNDGKRVRRSRRLEATARGFAVKAVKGDVDSAEMLLQMHAHSHMYGDMKEKIVHVMEDNPKS